MRGIKIPNTLVLLFAMMIVAWAATWIVPAGSFETQSEHEVDRVVPGTFSYLEQAPRLSPVAIFTVVPRALAEAAPIIFFIFIIGGAIEVLRATGTIDAVLGRMMLKFQERSAWLILICMATFAGASATIGMAEEYIALVPVLLLLCARLRLDAITAIGIMVCAYGVGYGAALFNPFTLFIAQEIAGVPLGSGWEYRSVLLLLFFGLAFAHVWRYARRIRRNPELSLMADVPQPAAMKGDSSTDDLEPLTSRHWAILAAGLLTMALVIYGLIMHEWYLVELSAIFLGLAILGGLLGKLSLDDIAEQFTRGASALTPTALLIGFAKSIALLLQDGQVLHTIVYAASQPLQSTGAEAAAVGMMAVQSALNLFIPSGSGQAYASMPLMVPIGDLVGVSRQVSVLAFQFGDGFMNMVVPTNAVLMGILGIAGIPYSRWLRFIGPLIAQVLVLGAVAMVVAVVLGY